MPWPDESQCVHFVDVSRYQNQDDYTAGLDQAKRARGRIDWVRFFQDNPTVKIVMARAAGSGSGPDPDFAWNYDEPVRLGRHAVPYVNNNPRMTTESLMQNWWKPTIDGRQPKLVVHDCESDQGFPDTAPSDALITDHIRKDLDSLKAEYGKVAIYTAAWFWDPRVLHGWEQNEDLWGAHYVYLVRNLNGTWRVAYNFTEADGAMPYASATFPRMPQGFTVARFRAWQFSERGKGMTFTVDGRPVPEVDLNYMWKDYYEYVFGGDANPPPVAVAPPIEVGYPRLWARASREWLDL